MCCGIVCVCFGTFFRSHLWTLALLNFIAACGYYFANERARALVSHLFMRISCCSSHIHMHWNCRQYGFCFVRFGSVRLVFVIVFSVLASVPVCLCVWNVYIIARQNYIRIIITNIWQNMIWNKAISSPNIQLCRSLVRSIHTFLLYKVSRLFTRWLKFPKQWP